MVVETPSFLELDYDSISRIFASNGILITSELEVYEAGDTWLSYNKEERNKFAKDLLQKVRLPLLSDAALKYLLNKSSSFTNNDASIAYLERILNKETDFIPRKSSKLYTVRYCNQIFFNIISCGGYDRALNKPISTVCQIDGNTLENVKNLPPMTEERTRLGAVCLKGEIYVFGGLDNKGKSIMYVEKYSSSTNSWNRVADVYDDRGYFCACAFMDKIFVISGYKCRTRINSCLQFDTKLNTWKEVNGMNGVRSSAACAVFEGNVTVAGGCDNDNNKLRSVESYDVVADEWSPMPNMINGKYCHSLVAVKNRLFVIGIRINNCEVFDNICNKFVAIKSPQVGYHLNKAISIGNKIVAIERDGSSTVCYDVDNDEWSEESSPFSEGLIGFSCVKIPLFSLKNNNNHL